MSQSPNRYKVLMGTPLWWGAFIAATYVLSLCFQGFKDFTLMPDWANGLRFAGFMSLLFAIMLLLVVDSYIKERHKGKIQRPVAFFERIYQAGFASPHKDAMEGSRQEEGETCR